MPKKMIAIIGALAFAGCLLTWTTSWAAENAGVNAAILQLALNWEHIKFEVTDKDLQEKQMAALSDRADTIVQQFPGRPEAAIWQAIIISEQASMASENGSPFKALGFAKQAREILEPIANQYPAVLDAGAPTSLGVLYPASRDSRSLSAIRRRREHYCKRLSNTRPTVSTPIISMATLYNAHEYPVAVQVFKHALSLPPHPERPIWDKSRRLVMQEDLEKMHSN